MSLGVAPGEILTGQILNAILLTSHDPKPYIVLPKWEIVELREAISSSGQRKAWILSIGLPDLHVQVKTVGAWFSQLRMLAKLHRAYH